MTKRNDLIERVIAELKYHLGGQIDLTEQDYSEAAAAVVALAEDDALERAADKAEEFGQTAIANAIRAMKHDPK